MHALRAVMSFTCTCTLYALVYQNTRTLLHLHVVNKMICMIVCHCFNGFSNYLDGVNFCFWVTNIVDDYVNHLVKF